MSWVLFIAAAVLFFLSVWVVVPAPTYALLVLGVGVPEVSPLLLALTIVSALLAWRFGGRMQTYTLALCAIAALLFVLPVARYPRDVPFSITRFVFGVDPGDARVTRGVSFAVADGQSLTMDIYQPRSPGRYLVVVQIYGGAWQRGAPGDYPEFAKYLAARGFVVFAIDYRHAPKWKWPAQFDDVRAGLAWVRAHAQEYDGDATKLALFGRSAGAHLAMLLALQDAAAHKGPPYDPPVISAIVSYYGPVNLTHGWREPPVPDPIGSRDTLEKFLGGTPDEMPDRYVEASPITYVSGRAPRSLLIYGARDHVVQSKYGRTLNDALRAAGASSEMIEIPWAEHAFDAVPAGIGGQVALFYTERFLTNALR